MNGDIAIVGLAGRFPGAGDVWEYWSNVAGGRTSIRTLDRAELRAAGVPEADLDDPGYVAARGVLDDPELFDAAFFGITPKEAAVMDPQHRLLLQTAWEALESGGLTTDAPFGRVGVFAGAGFNYYLLNRVLATPDVVRDQGLLSVVLGNEKDHLAAKIAYRLNLSGPAVAVQTACSTSLVAVHLACQSLRAGDSDVALAGGVCVPVPQQTGYLYEPSGILSADGACRPFDAEPGGTVPGSGVAMVALKRADDARRDGDTVYAVIKGSAINNDGNVKVGYTAPGVEGQVDVLSRAYASAGVDPATVGYLEAHGTATEVGDAIELAALTEVFGGRGGRCSLGSVKANVGHLDAAAGVAGLIKVALALHFRQIPPLAGLVEPRAEFAARDFPFTVDTTARPWTGDGVRRGAVSAFGLGGTNVHVVLEGNPEPAETPDHPMTGDQPALLLVSGRTAADLDAAEQRLAHHLSGPVDGSVHDVALTLQSHRRHFRHRRAVPARDLTQAVERLAGGRAREAGRRPSVVLLFPGQGAEYQGMSAAPYSLYPSFRADIDRGLDVLRPLLDVDLRAILLDKDRDGPDDLVHRTDVAQPALLLHGYALGRLLLSWGVRPSALIGHSVGEFAAACVARELSFPDAVELVARRGTLMQEAPPGGMLVTLASEEALRPHLRDLDVAAVNAPEIVVVAGGIEALGELRARLDAAGITHRTMPARRAFHSRLMADAAERLGQAAANVPARNRRIDIIDTVDGELLPRGGQRDAAYWARQLRSPVRFHQAVRTALALPRPVFVEVGPGRALTAAARQGGATVTVPVHPGRNGDAGDALIAAVGDLWAAGVDMDWAAFRGRGEARRVALPTYPFARELHTLAPAAPSMMEAPPETAPAPDSDAVLPWIIAAWRDLLGVAHVTADSNFFDLGGESLLFIRALARTRRQFGVPLDVDAVVNRPTPGAIAALVEAAIVKEND